MNVIESFLCDKNFHSVKIFILCLFTISLQAQEKVITVGIQMKPIIPNSFFRAELEKIDEPSYQITGKHLMGYTAGMVIRRGLSKRWSLETGINFIRRNYRFNYSIDSILNGERKVRIVSYEVPLLALLYIRLSDKWYMNTAFGASTVFYPSDVGFDNLDIVADVLRRNWVQLGLNANVGYEYRTEEKGYFYAGISLHRPFNNIYRGFFTFDTNNTPVQARSNLYGSYFTIDFRYFFHEDRTDRKR
ncbi:MAG: PorT family protein [Flavobacteriales bacterium]|nr:PorT family protein [Flavobacteriales bacterium]